MIDYRLAILCIIAAAWLGVMLGELREFRPMLPLAEKGAELATYYQKELYELIEKTGGKVGRG